VAAKLTRLTHKIDRIAPSGRARQWQWQWQFSLQAASPETFGYTIVCLTFNMNVFHEDEFFMLSPFLLGISVPQLSGCLLYRLYIICVYFVPNSFCALFTVFVLSFLHLSVCYVSLWLIPHPIVAITNLRIHGMYVCMYVCMYVQLFATRCSCAVVSLFSESV
jgi:hypothetical protein